MEWVLGAMGSVFIACVAYWKKALSASGAVAAVGVGTCLYALGSPVWFGLMIGFFVSSTMLTKWKKHRKRDAEAKYEKSGRRDAGQVLANGGIGTVLCILYAWKPDWSWLGAVYVGVMATVTADTWATEVGGLSKGQPRLILTWKQVPKGTSGGVSTLGWLASAAGGGFIGLLAAMLAGWDKSFVGEAIWKDHVYLLLVPAAMLSGWIGANADSLLGATVQAIYRCPICGEDTEAARHCGTGGILIKGWSKMNNDAVNMISSVAGGVIMLLLAMAWTWLGK